MTNGADLKLRRLELYLLLASRSDGVKSTQITVKSFVQRLAAAFRAPAFAPVAA